MQFKSNILLFFFLIQINIFAGLAPDTLIKTANNDLVSLKDLTTNDLVLSRCDLGLASNLILKNSQTNHGKYLKIFLAQDEILVSLNQRFYLPDFHRWLLARDLLVGDCLLDIHDNLVRIKKIELIQEPFDSYNLTVAQDHNFYISKDLVLVHNEPFLLTFASAVLAEKAFEIAVVYTAKAVLTVLAGYGLYKTVEFNKKPNRASKQVQNQNQNEEQAKVQNIAQTQSLLIPDRDQFIFQKAQAQAPVSQPVQPQQPEAEVALPAAQEPHVIPESSEVVLPAAEEPQVIPDKIPDKVIEKIKQEIKNITDKTKPQEKKKSKKKQKGKRAEILVNDDGDEKEMDKDFYSLPLSDVVEKENKKGKIKISVLPNGWSVTARNYSSDGRSTLEIITDSNIIKIRYGRK